MSVNQSNPNNSTFTKEEKKRRFTWSSPKAILFFRDACENKPYLAHKSSKLVEPVRMTTVWCPPRQPKFWTFISLPSLDEACWNWNSNFVKIYRSHKKQYVKEEAEDCLHLCCLNFGCLCLKKSKLITCHMGYFNVWRSFRICDHFKFKFESCLAVLVVLPTRTRRLKTCSEWQFVGGRNRSLNT